MTIPQSTVLDNFNRANETPLSNSGKWSQSPTATSGLRLDTNQAFIGGNNTGSYWNVARVGPDFEIYCTIVAYDSSSQGGFDLVLWGSPPATTPRLRYYMEINSGGGYAVHRIYRDGNALALNNGALNNVAVGLGVDKMLLRRVGSIVEAWNYTAARGWVRAVAVNELTADLATFGAPFTNGYAGVSLTANASAARVDDFGAATLVGGSGGLVELGVSGKRDRVAVRGYKPVPGGMARGISDRLLLARRMWVTPSVPTVAPVSVSSGGGVSLFGYGYGVAGGVPGPPGPAGPAGPPGPSPERGSVPTESLLPVDGGETGYIYYVEDTGHVWTWHAADPAEGEDAYWEDLGSFRGDPGPPGPPGPPGLTYEFTQASPSATWTVVHNLNMHPSVTVVDSGGSVIVPNVFYNDLNTLTIGFGSATTGKAFLN